MTVDKIELLVITAIYMKTLDDILLKNINGDCL